MTGGTGSIRKYRRTSSGRLERIHITGSEMIGNPGLTGLIGSGIPYPKGIRTGNFESGPAGPGLPVSDHSGPVIWIRSSQPYPSFRPFRSGHLDPVQPVRFRAGFGSFQIQLHIWIQFSRTPSSVLSDYSRRPDPVFR